MTLLQNYEKVKFWANESILDLRETLGVPGALFKCIKGKGDI